jgi:hypothetical protein
MFIKKPAYRIPGKPASNEGPLGSWFPKYASGLPCMHLVLLACESAAIFCKKSLPPLPYGALRA